MKRTVFSLALASFVSMAVPAALAADLARSPVQTYTSEDNIGCSCDAPGIYGPFCATPRSCRELSGLCLGGCTRGVSENEGCSCDASGIYGLFCATPRTCREMSGLCEGGC
jgi:uncharacterized protein YqkB